MNCYDCIHNGVCYLQEVTNDIEEQLKEFGCEDYKNKENFVRREVFEQVKWERDTAVKQLESYGVGFCENKELVEVKYGEWIEDGYNDIPCVCSRCGNEAPYKVISCHDKYDYNYYDELVFVGEEIEKEYIKTPYCPNCGADMRGEQK